MEDPRQLYITDKYLSQHPTWDAEHGPWKARQIWKTLPEEFIGLFKGKPARILDIGCGSGSVLRELVNEFRMQGIKVEAVGYDISPHAIEMAKRLTPDIEFTVGDRCY